MKIMRSFPLPGRIPPGRPYVCDDLPKLHTLVSAGGSADFSALRDLDEDVILIEWDVAVDRVNLARFADMAENRDWPIVAPHYKLGDDGTWHWVHFRIQNDGQDDGQPDGCWRPVFTGEPDCDQFAPGLAYFPAGLLKDCPGSDWGCSVMNEGVISRYLRSRPDWRPVPILWTVRTVHLH